MLPVSERAVLRIVTSRESNNSGPGKSFHSPFPGLPLINLCPLLTSLFILQVLALAEVGNVIC